MRNEAACSAASRSSLPEDVRVGLQEEADVGVPDSTLTTFALTPALRGPVA
jgi:hypothetical protein